ncbi:MAG: hypothetical protein EOP11_22145, partial [Proteobacteria bacterium]
MRFNRVLLSCLLALIFTLNTACSLRVGEELEQTKITVNPAKEGCLANAGSILDRYFEGKIEEPELVAFWDCTEKAFTMFVQNTKGGAGDRYAPSELGAFLSKYFLEGKKIDPKLLAETMVLKQGLVGGSAETLSRAELEQILSLLRTVRLQSVKLRQFMPITASSFRERNFSADQFELALATFESSMGAIGKDLQNVQGAYTMDHAAAFLK